MNPSPELAAALDAAEAASTIALSLYRHNLEVRIKEDKSPVTDADVAARSRSGKFSSRDFPRTAFTARRPETRDRGAESLWLVDPIDGTKAFVREYPFSRPRSR